MLKFPKCIPLELREYVQSLVKKGGLGDFKPILEALVTDPSMESAWKALSKHSQNPQQLIDYLEYVRLHDAVIFGQKSKGKIDIPSQAIPRQSYNKIEKLLGDVINELSKIGDNDPEAGWVLLQQAFERRGNRFPDQLSNIHSLQSLLSDLQTHGSIPLILEAIQTSAKEAALAPSPDLPTKRNSRNAKVNQLIHDLSLYCDQHFTKDLHAVVANTINTLNSALGWSGNPVSPNDVLKLKHLKS